jgi:hypothetical protein
LTTGAVIHLRGYAADGLRRAAELPEGWVEQPVPYLRFLHKHYRAVYRPEALRPPAVTATVVATGDEIAIDRLVVIEPALEYRAGIVLVSAFVPQPFTVQMERPNYVHIHDRERLGWRLDDGDASSKFSMQWICDQTLTELFPACRVTPTGPYRSAFSHLCYFWDGLPDSVTDGAATAPGIEFRPGEEDAPDPSAARDVIYAVNERMTVKVSRPVTARVFGGGESQAETGYLALASALCRATLMLHRLNSKAVEEARNVAARSKSTWKVVDDVARLQAEAIVVRDEIAGTAVHRFDYPALRGLYTWALDTPLGIPQDQREGLEGATNSLQSLATALVGSGLNRSQKLFGLGGLIFATLSVAFASVGVIDFVTNKNLQTWVYVALAAAFFVAAVMYVTMSAVLSRRA